MREAPVDHGGARKRSVGVSPQNSLARFRCVGGNTRSGQSWSSYVLLSVGIAAGEVLFFLIGMASGAAEQNGTPNGSLRSWIPKMQSGLQHQGELQELAKTPRVVVAMTSIPWRLAEIEPVVDAMLRQTWPVAAVYMSLPYVFGRSGEPYVVPEWMKTKPGLQLLRCEDMGPGTHLLNGLRVEREPGTYLVVVDDDHIYAPDLVENLLSLPSTGQWHSDPPQPSAHTHVIVSYTHTDCPVLSWPGLSSPGLDCPVLAWTVLSCPGLSCPVPKVDFIGESHALRPCPPRKGGGQHGI